MEGQRKRDLEGHTSRKVYWQMTYETDERKRKQNEADRNIKSEARQIK